MLKPISDTIWEVVALFKKVERFLAGFIAMCLVMAAFFLWIIIAGIWC